MGVLESAAWRKYQSLGGDLDKALGEKLIADVKDHVEGRARALGESMGKKLDAAAGPAPASAPTGGK